MITAKKIQFESEGIQLTGTWRSSEEATNKPVIIIAPSWINIKEQFAAIYGERLAKLGYHTFTFDFRNYGESEGQPRNYEVPLDKVTDFKNAINYAAQQPNVSAIYVLGVCAGAGHVVMAAAGDQRVQKMALVASWLHDSEAVKLFYGGQQGVADKIKKSRAARQQFEKTGEVIYAPKVSLTNSEAAMYGDFNYYLDSKRGLLPEWQPDQFAVMSWEPWLTYDPNPYAASIHCPVIMVHSETAALPQQVKTFFNNIQHTPKVIYWTNGSQFDFYDGSPVDEAIQQVHHFFS
jgi:dienelactone hydrolase